MLNFVQEPWSSPFLKKDGSDMTLIVLCSL